MMKVLKALLRHSRGQLQCHRARLLVTSNAGLDLRCCLATSAGVLKERKYTPRRAVLYVPGNDERKLLKIPTLNVDCAVMDCEDGVALNRKVSIPI